MYVGVLCLTAKWLTNWVDVGWPQNNILDDDVKAVANLCHCRQALSRYRLAVENASTTTTTLMATRLRRQSAKLRCSVNVVHVCVEQLGQWPPAPNAILYAKCIANCNAQVTISCEIVE